MTWLRYQFRTFEKVFIWWRDNLTVGGKMMTGAILLCAPELATLDSPLFFLFWAQLSLLAVTGVFSYLWRPHVGVHVLAPPSSVRGEPVDLIVQVTNQSPQTVYDLWLDLLDAPQGWDAAESRRFLASLPSGGSRKLTLTVQPTRRGRFHLPPIRVTSTFPLNLIRVWQTHEFKGELLVLPSYRPLAALELSRTASALIGDQIQYHASVGHGSDYAGSREYLPGMAVRRWDYSSWARLGQPVVREFTDPHQPTAAIIADTSAAHLDGGDEPDPELEAAIALIAALSDELTQQRYRIAFLGTGDGLLELAHAGVAEQHSFVARALAPIEPVARESFAEICIELQSTPLVPGIVFFVLRDWDATCKSLCEDLVLRGAELIRIFTNEQAADKAGMRAGDIVASPEEIATGRVDIS